MEYAVAENLVTFFIIFLVGYNLYSLKRKKAVRQFRRELLNISLSDKVPEKNYLQLKKEFSIGKKLGTDIAAEFYSSILQMVFEDKEIDEQEHKKLVQIREYLGLDPAKIQKIEKKEVHKLYFHFMDHFLSDDIIQQYEAAQLRLLKENIKNIFPETSIDIGYNKQTQILNKTLKKIKADGIITESEQKIYNCRDSGFQM
ncbi:hypothetical protein ACFL35_13840, partial [Candidatus Riflebacteria bacterium]